MGGTVMGAGGSPDAAGEPSPTQLTAPDAQASRALLCRYARHLA